MKVSKCIKDMELLKTMKWIGLNDACRYARRSITTLKKLIALNEIYGTKRGGEWVVDRESIDAYFNRDRDEMRIKLHGRGL
jgi:hypothetical protein